MSFKVDIDLSNLASSSDEEPNRSSNPLRQTKTRRNGNPIEVHASDQTHAPCPGSTLDLHPKRLQHHAASVRPGQQPFTGTRPAMDAIKTGPSYLLNDPTLVQMAKVITFIRGFLDAFMRHQS